MSRSAYTLHGLIAPSFAEHAASTAIVQGTATVTYAQLNDMADRVSSFLNERRERDSNLFFVGLTSAVSIESIAAAIGILRAGCCYIPLDVHSPPDRIRSVIDDAGIALAFADEAAYPQAPRALASDGCTRVSLGNVEAKGDGDGAVPWREVLRERKSIPPAAALADDLAYVLYTSGSTGVPKGVMLTHRNAVTFVRWMNTEFGLSPEDRVAGRSPLNFDFSVFDVFSTLAAGATLHLQDRAAGERTREDRHRDYVQMLQNSEATILYATPSALTVLMEKGDLSQRVSLRTIMYAGEPFPAPALARLMRALPNTRVANIYGPTETNIITCYWVPEPPTQAVPIGVEVDDTEIAIVRDGKLRAVGEEGELWARGGTVCVGYLNQPELTAQRLVRSPFHPYPVWYWRTGDIGRRLDSGDIVLAGRTDDMVKTRGYRVEIGEVETALAATDGVTQGIVIPRSHPKYGATLHGFVLLKDGAPAPEELLSGLGNRLPYYMVPRTLKVLDRFPYTSTGKVDRQALKAKWLGDGQ